MLRLAGLLVLVMAFVGGPAAASSRCRVPLADWQPRQALQQKLEADGWRIEMLRVNDGCYHIHARNPRGERLEAMFNPATLEMVSRRPDRRRDDS